MPFTVVMAASRMKNTSITIFLVAPLTVGDNGNYPAERGQSGIGASAGSEAEWRRYS